MWQKICMCSVSYMAYNGNIDNNNNNRNDDLKLYSCVSKVIQVQSFSTCIPDTFLICVLKFKIKWKWKKFFVRYNTNFCVLGMQFPSFFPPRDIYKVFYAHTHNQRRINREKILQYFFYYLKFPLFIVHFFHDYDIFVHIFFSLLNCRM